MARLSGMETRNCWQENMTFLIWYIWCYYRDGFSTLPTTTPVWFKTPNRVKICVWPLLKMLPLKQLKDISFKSLGHFGMPISRMQYLLSHKFPIFISQTSIVGFFIPVSSLKVFGRSIHSERRRIYLGKSIQALQNDTIIISWISSFRVIRSTLPWHSLKSFMFVFINS